MSQIMPSSGPRPCRCLPEGRTQIIPAAASWEPYQEWRDFLVLQNPFGSLDEYVLQPSTRRLAARVGKPSGRRMAWTTTAAVARRVGRKGARARSEAGRVGITLPHH